MIKKLKVKNFKSLKDFVIDFTEPISILAGPNMAGKSNIIDALMFIYDSISAGFAEAVRKRNGYFEIKWKGEGKNLGNEAQSDIISFFIEGDIYLSKYKKIFDYSYLFEFSGDAYGNIFLKKEELIIDGKSIITSSPGNVKFRNDLETEKDNSIEPFNQLFLHIVNPSNGISYEFKSILLKIYFYFLEPTSMKNTQNPSSSQQFLSYNGDNLSSWLLTIQTKYRDNFERLISALRNILPDIKNIFANLTQSSTVYLSSEENYISGNINLANMSDGEVKLVALLSLIFAPSELTPYFVIVEEPENYLHPGVLRSLVEYLRDVRKEAEKRTGYNSETNSYAELSQILISSHSIVLIDNFKIEELIIVKKKQGATSVIYPKNETEMKKLIEDKEIGLGPLYFSGVLN